MCHKSGPLFGMLAGDGDAISPRRPARRLPQSPRQRQSGQQRAELRNPRHDTPGGPITGNRVAPSSWQKTPQGGPMLLAGDSTAAGRAEGKRQTSLSLLFNLYGCDLGVSGFVLGRPGVSGCVSTAFA